MKTLKIATIATAITLALIALCGIATAENADTYNLNAVVTAWEQIGDTALRVVTVTDENGNEWAFFDDEDYWKVGDVVILTMMDMSEEHDELDEVMDVERIGHLDWFGLLDWLK